MELFQMLEDYQRLLYDSEKKIENSRNISLKTDCFNILINCNDRGIVSCNIFDREEGNINSYVADINKSVILSKISVQKSSLPPLFKQILEESKKSNVKKLMKK